jgi:hypothetical protein
MDWEGFERYRLFSSIENYPLRNTRVRNMEATIWKGMADIRINSQRNTSAKGIPTNDSTITTMRIECVIPLESGGSHAEFRPGVFV